MKKTNDLHSDKAVAARDEDAFQRYAFAERIARAIAGQKSTDSLVTGIYAKWGEGKTSVLNFIKLELENEPDVIAIDFNPWMYSADEQLLLSFFQVLSVALDKPLKGKGENIGKLIRDYAGTLGVLGSTQREGCF